MNTGFSNIGGVLHDAVCAALKVGKSWVKVDIFI